MPSHGLPSKDEYYLGIAKAVRRKANCKGYRVGAVVVREDRVVSTGYNGTPQGMDNCLDGGCHRCANRDSIGSGHGYDLCICVHAEQNALLTAARFGIPLDGSGVYTTLQPCFGCMKEMLQAKVEKVVYLHPWQVQEGERATEYARLRNRFSDRMVQLTIEDEDADWALGRSSSGPPEEPTDEHGHST